MPDYLHEYKSFFDRVRLDAAAGLRLASTRRGSPAEPSTEAAVTFALAYADARDRGRIVDVPHVAVALCSDEKVRATIQTCGGDPDIASKRITADDSRIEQPGLMPYLPLRVAQWFATGTWSQGVATIFALAAAKAGQADTAKFFPIDVLHEILEAKLPSALDFAAAGLSLHRLRCYLAHGQVELPLPIQHGDPSGKTYHVRIDNDRYTTMDFVVSILRDVFKLNNAEEVMLEIHNRGSHTLGPYTWDEALGRINAVCSAASTRDFPLKTVIEHLDRPRDRSPSVEH